jgi:ribonucleotide monophosphatase NagD (HAD superfamily)
MQQSRSKWESDGYLCRVDRKAVFSVRGQVIFAGKPEAASYTEALDRAKTIAGRDISKSRLLAVGDGLPTDIKGAADNGFDAYFIAGGIHAIEFNELGAEGGVKKAINTIKSRYSKLNLVGVCDHLRWI